MMKARVCCRWFIAAASLCFPWMQSRNFLLELCTFVGCMQKFYQWWERIQHDLCGWYAVICQVSVVLKEILQLIQTKSYYNPDRDFILQNKIQKHSITMHGITERQWHFAYLRLNTVIIKARNMVKCLSFKISTTNLDSKFTINLYLIRWHQRWLSLINQI